MKNSVKEELSEYITERVEEIQKYEGNEMDDLHFHLFNEDYYIIGYYQAAEWLKTHNISEWEAIQTCQEYEVDNFGESRIYDNAEKTVNMLAYIWGEEILSDMNLL
tara:strand:+ start:99 stop:416 length:318 start_codon:yes stop_codon:yes gene_type:complete